MLRRVCRTFFTFFGICLLISCSGDEELLPEEPVSPILGKWVLNESRQEILSNPNNVSLEFADQSGLEWTFFDNDSLLVEDMDTVFTLWYQYDTTDNVLRFENGYYDILSLDQDSLNLRILTELDFVPIEFYTYFDWLRASE